MVGGDEGAYCSEEFCRRGDGPAPAHLIEGGIPTEALLAHVAVAKYTFASRRTRPGPSTMQTLVLIKDTSNPAYCSMVVPP
jgi:hypothetical protein